MVFFFCLPILTMTQTIPGDGHCFFYSVLEHPLPPNASKQFGDLKKTYNTATTEQKRNLVRQLHLETMKRVLKRLETAASRGDIQYLRSAALRFNKGISDDNLPIAVPDKYRALIQKFQNHIQQNVMPGDTWAENVEIEQFACDYDLYIQIYLHTERKNGVINTEVVSINPRGLDDSEKISLYLRGNHYNPYEQVISKLATVSAGKKKGHKHVHFDTIHSQVGGEKVTVSIKELVDNVPYNNQMLKNHAPEILKAAEHRLNQLALQKKPLVIPEDADMESVDDLLVQMVEEFNANSEEHKVTLFNGINGEPLVTMSKVANRQFKNHIFVRLGHMLLPMTEATLSKQLGVSATYPGTILEKVRKNVHVEGDFLGIQEATKFDATLKKKVRQTGSPITVVAYSVGRKMRYSHRDPSKQMVQERQYLYQGVLPREFRKKGQMFCYALSKFPPTIQMDLLNMQRDANVDLNLAEPVDQRVLSDGENSGGEGVAMMAAAVGIITTFVSSLAMIL